MAKERLQKVMAKAGYGSRRACEEIIEQGHVTINGRVAKLGDQADPTVDDIRIKFEKLRTAEPPLYIMFNKPRGVISDEDVAGNWPRARDMIPLEGHLYPVGRLDVPSQGLMLFTNDGNLAHKLSHPRYEHPKTYHIVVEGNPSEKALDTWRRGILLDDQPTGRAEITRIGRTKKETVLEVTVREGRKRQLRRIASILGHPVISLVRIKLGSLELGDLPEGSWRRLTEDELKVLSNISRSSSPRPRRLSSSKPENSRPSSRPLTRGRRTRPATSAKSKSKRGTQR
jgi:23S rRNA pseudouridine2605 synthase